MTTMAPQAEPSGAHDFDRAQMPTPPPTSAAWLPKGPGPHFVDMRLLCQAIVDEMSARATRQHVTVALELSSERATAIGFADQLFYAIRLIVKNALAAMPSGGRLIVRVERDPYVVVEVVDTGAERPAADSNESRTIIERHRGYVWHRRQPGGGTCVIVELPASGPGGPGRRA